MTLPDPDNTYRFLYIFLDEAGNLDFSPASGSRYFVQGGIAKERPFHAYKELTELKTTTAPGLSSGNGRGKMRDRLSGFARRCEANGMC